MEMKTTVTACSTGDFRGAEIVLEDRTRGTIVEASEFPVRVIDPNFEI